MSDRTALALLALLLLVGGPAAPARKRKRKRGRRATSTPRAHVPTLKPLPGKPRKPRGYDPISAEEVVERALAQRGLGSYQLGGGARFDAPDVTSPLGNRFPGKVDCTGLVAYAGGYRRIWESASAIVDDAIGPARRFMLVPHGSPVRASDLLVTRRHAGVIVEVLPGFVRGAPGWWKRLRVAQSAGQSYGRMPAENVEDDRGSVRVTNAYRWRKGGYLVRMRHVT